MHQTKLTDSTRTPPTTRPKRCAGSPAYIPEDGDTAWLRIVNARFTRASSTS